MCYGWNVLYLHCVTFKSITSQMCCMHNVLHLKYITCKMCCVLLVVWKNCPIFHNFWGRAEDWLFCNVPALNGKKQTKNKKLPYLINSAFLWNFLKICYFNNCFSDVHFPNYGIFNTKKKSSKETKTREPFTYLELGDFSPSLVIF